MNNTMLRTLSGRTLIRRALALVLCLLFAASALTACTPAAKPAGESSQNSEKSDESASEADSAGSKAAQGEPAESTEPLKGGTAVMGITQEPDFLDPHLAVAAGTKEILFNLFEGLVKMDAKGEFKPCLAESWTQEDEGRTLRFVLRPNVLFHNGKAVTAEDVVYSLKRAAGLSGKEALVPQLAGLESVEASEDGKEVIVRQKETNPDLIGFLTCAILPADYDKQNEQPVGTGPFMFESYTPQVSLKMKRFEDYWGKAPYLDEVEFRIYGSMDAAYMELVGGQLDLFPYLTQEKAESLKDKYNICIGGANMVQLMALNNDREPLNKKEVREAINLAVDRQKLIDLVMGSYGTPLASGMSPEMGRFYNDKLEPVKQDIEAAKAKLAEAGYPDGLDLTVTVPGNYLIHVDTANILAAQLKEAGIRLKIETVEWGTWLERVYAGRDYEMTIIALTFEYTPSDVLDRYASAASNDFINFRNEAYDKLVQEAATETDDAKRVEQYHELQRILYDETASIFLQDPMNLTAVRKGLDGYVQYPAYVQDLSGVYYTNQEALDASKTR